MDPRVVRLQQRLAAVAEPEVKAWWEAYMRHAAAFRGVPLPRVREEVRAWRAEEGLGALPPEEQLEVAMALFEAPDSEDKLAGVLYLQLFLLDAVPWRTVVARLGPVFRDHVPDWGVCDWTCVKVLGPLVAAHGMPCARAVAAWSASAHLWQARAGLVAFVNLTDRAEFHPLMLRAAERLIRREERFAKTAVGWAFRELGRRDPRAVVAFVGRERPHFSREALQNAAKGLPAAQRAALTRTAAGPRRPRRSCAPRRRPRGARR